MVKQYTDYRRFRSDVPKNLFRIPITVTMEMDEWLHKLSSKMKVSDGYKLPKSYIVRSIINAMMNLDIDVDGIKSEEELEKRIIEAIKKHK